MKELFESDKKRIVAAVVEILVNLVMASHVYTFGDKWFIQVDGGPIGLRSTASLALLIIKIWVLFWMKLMDRKGLKLLDYFHYVDDIRLFMRPLYEGWKWNGCCFEFRESWKEDNLLSGKTDQERTLEQMILAMNSLVEYLQFEGDSAEMFHDYCCLP